MVKAEFQKLMASIDESMECIGRLKSNSVRLQQYEFTAKLRDIEKKIESVKELIKQLN